MMADQLSSFCVACARFTAGDRLAELLAVAATAPYFAVYHTAVLLHARRELHIAFVFLGMIFTSVLSTVIKKALKQPRPSAMCALLGNCHTHGMPSSHSAVMAFAATTCLFLFRHRQSARQHPQTAAAAPTNAASGGSTSKSWAARLTRAVELFEIQLLVLLTTAVAYGRVYLGYHSPVQVAVGLALGCAVAAAWWQVTLAVCQSRLAPALLKLLPLRALCLRNTLGCHDVHAEEAACFARFANASPAQHPAAGKQQQQHAD